MSFRHNFTVYYWLFSKFIVKYEIPFLTRGNFIDGYIDTASIDAISSSFIFQFWISHSSFTCDAWTIMNFVYFI